MPSCVLLASLAFPNPALATHSSGSGPGYDFIGGTVARGTFPIPCPPGSADAHFHASAQAAFETSGAGPNVVKDGHYWTALHFNPPCLGFTDAYVEGNVTCLNSTFYQAPAAGNSAVWRGEITKAVLQPGSIPGIPGVLAPGMTTLSRFIDNDGPFGPPGAPDQAIQFTTPPGQTTCPGVPFTTLPIIEGNLVVHDAL